jgi:tetratricopeptide (TPR) repeat protein
MTRRVMNLARFLIALVMLSARARADGLAEAKQHYDRGTTLYDLQRFVEAAHEYEQAYELIHDPALLFNIGQAFRFGGDYAKAIGAFRSYLRRLPDAENREEVMLRIAEMQKHLDEQKTLNEKPPEGTIAPVAPAPPPAAPAASPAPVAAPAVAAPAANGRTRKIAGGVTVGGGVVLLVAGIALEALARQDFNQINSPSQGYVFNPSTQTAMKSDEIGGGVLIGIGLAAAVAGATVTALGYREGRPARVALAPGFDRRGAAVALIGSF